MQVARCPLLGEGMHLWRYGWVLSTGAELGAECTGGWEPLPCEGASSVVHLRRDVPLRKGPALGSWLPAEGAGNESGLESSKSTAGERVVGHCSGGC